MEEHLQGIDNLITSASDEDRSCSRQLAVVLLTIREYLFYVYYM